MLTVFSGLFYGWRMIAIGSALRILGGGLHLYGFTVFFLPLSRDLGLSRAATSLVFSLARAEGAVEGPLAGYLIDRYGPRPIMLTAVLLSGLGYMLLSTVDSYLSFLLVYLGVVSLSFGAGFMHSPMVLANTWFIRRRALAMTLISASIGLGGAFLSPLVALSVHAWGWRRAALLAGIGFFLLGVPLAAMVRRSPESIGLLPDGEPPGHPKGATHTQPTLEEPHFSAARAMRTSAFWMLVFATTFRVAGLGAITVHFIPMMVWKGLSAERAALLLGAFAFLSLPSHLLIGWIADRVPKPRLMAVIMLIGAAALLVLIHGEGEQALWLFTVLFTAVESIFPVSWALVGDFYGRKSFATIRGVMSFFYMWGGVVAPVVAGAVYDQTQSYGSLLPILVAIFLLAAVLYGLLVKPAAGAYS